MEVDRDAGVNSNTLHRLGVGVGCTSSTPKEVAHARTHGDFCMLHYIVYMPQGGPLCRGQEGDVGIV